MPPNVAVKRVGVTATSASKVTAFLITVSSLFTSLTILCLTVPEVLHAFAYSHCAHPLHTTTG